jgi:DNA-binding CsgD family transcriptional regulator
MPSSSTTTMGEVMGQRAEVVVSAEEREVLERWARRRSSAQALAFRCRVVLAAAEGRSSVEIAAELGCTRSTVAKWRGRFARDGLDGLHDEPRPGPRVALRSPAPVPKTCPQVVVELGIVGDSGARLLVAWFDRVLTTSTVAVQAAEGLSTVA